MRRNNVNKLKKSLFGFFILFSGFSNTVLAHCQVPCGIYDDHARVKAMLEDVATIKKAIDQMVELSGKADGHSKNQFVRWVMNKEQHAENIISTISDYFLTQRVKTSQKDYLKRLEAHHKVMVMAMKAKQQASSKVIKPLQDSIMALISYYPEHKHD